MNDFSQQLIDLKIITGKSEVQQIVNAAIEVYHQSGPDAFVAQLHRQLLKQKIRFPLLELASLKLYETLPGKKQPEITDKIFYLHEIGSSVIAGILLQQRLSEHFQQSISKAVEYIIAGDKWYVCDIVGERVIGFALLNNPELAVPVLKKLSGHPDKWIVRSVGVATHYAVKKGLPKKYVAQQFELLLTLADTTDFHTKKGIGWAAKTIAKFHPAIVQQHQREIENSATIKQWFKSKIKTGLSRSAKYAARYTG